MTFFGDAALNLKKLAEEGEFKVTGTLWGIDYDTAQKEVAYPPEKINKFSILVNSQCYEPQSKQSTIKDMQVLAGTAQDAAVVGFRVGVDEDDEVVFLCPAHPSPIAPEEASATLLAQLVADAEGHMGTPVRSAVITVPAYYNERQRQATLTAAAIAGLTDVSLLSEPVAACLAYGLSGAVGRVRIRLHRDDLDAQRAG